MEVRPGYKQTEVGVIPDDWTVKPLGDLFAFSGGLTASRDQLSPSVGYCYLHYGDIHTSKKSYVDVRAEYQDIPKLDIPLAKVSSVSLLADGDVVFVDASEDDAGTSKHVVVINPDGSPFIAGLHTIVAKAKSDALDRGYRRYCFQAPAVQAQFRFFAVGTKVSGVSKTNIAKISLSVPSAPEQEAIAEALIDADALIESLEQLLAKKRQLKQGAMQELLSGKTRLPGFSGKWVVANLDSVVDRITGAWGANDSSPDHPRQIDIIRAGDISQGGLLTRCAQRFLSDAEFARVECRLDDILITTSGAGLGKVWWCDGRPNTAASNFVRILRPRRGKSCGRYLSYVLRGEVGLKQLQEHTATSAYPNLRPSFFAAPWLSLAPISEQMGIAAILSDMDAEIAALESKLAKARQLKQGMMQELLTGQIRLA